MKYFSSDFLLSPVVRAEECRALIRRAPEGPESSRAPPPRSMWTDARYSVVSVTSCAGLYPMDCSRPGPPSTPHQISDIRSVMKVNSGRKILFCIFEGLLGAREEHTEGILGGERQAENVCRQKPGETHSRLCQAYGDSAYAQTL